VTAGERKPALAGKYESEGGVVDGVKVNEMSRVAWLVGLEVLTWMMASGVMGSFQNAKGNKTSS